MNTSENVKNKSHPWRTYGSPISKQWGETHEVPKSIVDKEPDDINQVVLKKNSTDDQS